MTKLLAISLYPGLCGHLALALGRYRKLLRESGYPEPDGLVDLEAFAVEVVTSTQQASPSVTVSDSPENRTDDQREYLTRHDVHLLLAQVSRRLTDGSAQAGFRRAGTAAPVESRAETSSDSGVEQRDLGWLRQATVAEIDAAFEHGELDQLLGQHR